MRLLQRRTPGFIPGFREPLQSDGAETPLSAARTRNVILKGLKARLNETGLVGSTFDSSDQTRVALGTTASFGAVVVVLAMFFWSFAMLCWNADYRWQASTAVSLWTGTITVLTFLLMLLVAVVVVSAVAHAVKSSFAGRARIFMVPLILIVTCASILIWDVHESLRFVIARGGIEWSHPGVAIKQLAGVTTVATSNVIWAWSRSSYQLLSIRGLAFAAAPVAVVIVAASTARVIRRL